MINRWEENAKCVENVYGSYVNWDNRFYICPECGEAVYEVDWDNDDLENFMCPICEWTD